jgi:adenylate cyclase
MADKSAKASKFSPQFARTLFAAFVGAVLAAGLGWFLQTFRPGEGLRHASYDLLHKWRGEVRPDQAVVVYMDDQSHAVLNQPLNAPWSRKVHAQLVDRLAKAGAKAIVFDIIFSDPNPAEDPEFAAAMQRFSKVILGADNVPGVDGSTIIVRACDELLNSAADFGSVERVPDPDLIVRMHTPRGDNPIGVLSWVTAQAVECEITTVPGAEQERRWLNYYGRPNVLPKLSYHEVLKADPSADLGVSNRVVYVGAKIITKFAGDRKDEFPSPFSSFDKVPVFMAGVEIQATEYLNLVRQDWVRRLPHAAEEVLVLLAGLLFGAGLVFMPPLRATVVAVVLLGVLIGGCFFAFSHYFVWIVWTVMVVQLVLAFAWSVLFNSVQLYVDKRLFEHTLGLYLPPQLVGMFSSSPELLKPGAEKQLLTFIFTDIADFTSISEGMDGDELAGMMNEYFQPAVANCIHKTEGTVVKYIGDAIFALWNAPKIQLDHAERACEAALLFRDLAKHPVRGRKLRTRIGLHTGVANVGNFGSLERFDYTAIGENVNMASRMEGLNKYLGTDCLISGATRQHIGDRFVTRRIGLFQLKGFEGLVEVHELVGFKEQAEATQAWREAFREALENFEQRNIVFSELGFRRVLELKPDDGPAMHYLKRIEEVNAEALPDTWATHTILKDK